jgi:alkaline phosphatase D
MAKMHESIRTSRAMSPLFRRVPSLAVWGERDFGPENSDRTFLYAKESMFAFRRYWPNPMYGTPEARGVFFNAQCGDAEFFCLDARMQRDPHPPANERKSLFGKAQLDWLKEQLKASKAAIKVIAASSPMLGDDAQGWAGCGEEREEFLTFLQKEKISGVVFVSRGSYGQVLCRKTKDDLFYPLYELVCPPLNVMPGKPGQEALRVGEPTVENGFATLSFGGTKIKRFVTLQIRDEKGGIKQDQTLFVGNLQAP